MSDRIEIYLEDHSDMINNYANQEVFRNQNDISAPWEEFKFYDYFEDGTKPNFNITPILNLCWDELETLIQLYVLYHAEKSMTLGEAELYYKDICAIDNPHHVSPNILGVA